MKTKSVLFVGGIGIGLALAGFVLRSFGRRSHAPNLYITGKDLDYSEITSDELIQRHLIDLNSAKVDQLNELGLNAESANRLIENRPYRSKLDLLSRMILPQEAYSMIKDKIGVADAREAIKIA